MGLRISLYFVLISIFGRLAIVTSFLKDVDLRFKVTNPDSVLHQKNESLNHESSHDYQFQKNLPHAQASPIIEAGANLSIGAGMKGGFGIKKSINKVKEVFHNTVRQHVESASEAGLAGSSHVGANFGTHKQGSFGFNAQSKIGVKTASDTILGTPHSMDSGYSMGGTHQGHLSGIVHGSHSGHSTKHHQSASDGSSNSSKDDWGNSKEHGDVSQGSSSYPQIDPRSALDSNLNASASKEGTYSIDSTVEKNLQNILQRDRPGFESKQNETKDESDRNTENGVINENVHLGGLSVEGGMKKAADKGPDFSSSIGGQKSAIYEMYNVSEVNTLNRESSDHIDGSLQDKHHSVDSSSATQESSDTRNLLNDKKNNDSEAHGESDQNSLTYSDESFKREHNSVNLSGYEAGDLPSGTVSLKIEDSLNDHKNNDSEVYGKSGQNAPTDSDKSLKNKGKSNNLNGYEAEDSSSGEASFKIQDLLNDHKNNNSDVHRKSDQKSPADSDESLANVHTSENLDGYKAEDSSSGKGLLDTHNLLNDDQNNDSRVRGVSDQNLSPDSDKSLKNKHNHKNSNEYKAEDSSSGEGLLDTHNLLNDDQNNDSRVRGVSDQNLSPDSDKSLKNKHNHKNSNGYKAEDSSSGKGLLDTHNLLNDDQNNDSRVRGVSDQNSSPDSDKSLKNKHNHKNLNGYEAYNSSSGEGSLKIEDSLNDHKNNDLGVHGNSHQKLPKGSDESLKNTPNSKNLSGYEAEGSSAGEGSFDFRNILNDNKNNDSRASGESDQNSPTASDGSSESNHDSEVTFRSGGHGSIPGGEDYINGGFPKHPKNQSDGVHGTLGRGFSAHSGGLLENNLYHSNEYQAHGTYSGNEQSHDQNSFNHQGNGNLDVSNILGQGYLVDLNSTQTSQPLTFPVVQQGNIQESVMPTGNNGVHSSWEGDLPASVDNSGNHQYLNQDGYYAHQGVSQTQASVGYGNDFSAGYNHLAGGINSSHNLGSSNHGHHYSGHAHTSSVQNQDGHFAHQGAPQFHASGGLQNLGHVGDNQLGYDINFSNQLGSSNHGHHYLGHASTSSVQNQEGHFAHQGASEFHASGGYQNLGHVGNNQLGHDINFSNQLGSSNHGHHYLGHASTSSVQNQDGHFAHQGAPQLHASGGLQNLGHVGNNQLGYDINFSNQLGSSNHGHHYLGHASTSSVQNQEGHFAHQGASEFHASGGYQNLGHVGNNQLGYDINFSNQLGSSNHGHHYSGHAHTSSVQNQDGHFAHQGVSQLHASGGYGNHGNAGVSGQIAVGNGNYGQWSSSTGHVSNTHNLNHFSQSSHHISSSGNLVAGNSPKSCTKICDGKPANAHLEYEKCSKHFCHCDVGNQAWLKECGPGTLWDDGVKTCNHPAQVTGCAMG
ncbi:hypothetical protein QAD02_010952 [Eretmocerus hayati]|uniref:Uncharacterized protein n=1 Tax=Eretmocerus hayati TaxID=131215 RepID=A0ACC2NWH4_9HYME|nr:hypothetical protein QAD02_010952 [Eretmocerus hayati]